MVMKNVLYKNVWGKWTTIILLLFFLKDFKMIAQTHTYAQTIISESHTNNSGNTIDFNQASYATINASTGIAIGIGAYSGFIELEFPTTLPANTTSYVKIETEDNLLDVLLGGSLGGLLSDVLAVALIGNQEFTVQAKLNNTVVLEGNSQIPNDFASQNLKIVINELGEHFIVITPNNDYNRIRIRNRVGSLLGLNNTKSLYVYSAFYNSSPSECGEASFTSFHGDGLTLDLLTLGGAGVNNPENVIDGDLNSYSELSLGVLDIAGSIEQIVYFEGHSEPDETFNIRMRIDPSLLALGILNKITINSFDGQNVANSVYLDNIVNLDLLALLQSNQIVTIPYVPGMSIDKICVKYSSILNTTLIQKIDLFDISKALQPPTIDINSQNVTACSSTTVNLIANSTPSSNQIYWYSAETDIVPIEITNSGEPFITPLIIMDTTFYVATKDPNCSNESVRIPVTVTMNTSPIDTDLMITGNENPICAINDVILTPSSTLTGEFHWYFDTNATNEITNGLITSDITYLIETNGILTITGLSLNNSPMTYYLSITDSSTGCSNAAGDLLPVTVIIIDETTPTTNDDTQDFCLLQNATVADLQTNESPIVWYSNPNGGTALDPITPLSNGIYYGAFVGATCESSIRLAVTVNIVDEDTPTTINNTQEFCSSQNPTVADLQTNESPVIWYLNPSGGTALDPTTLLINGIYYGAFVGATCESSVRLVVTVVLNSTSEANINGEVDAICFNNIYTYTTESGMTNYEWTVTGGTITSGGDSASDFVTIDWDQSMAGSITVTYYSSSLCNGSATNTLNLTIKMCSNLVLTKVANHMTSTVGETIVFTVTVFNDGTSDSNNVEVSEQITSGFTYVSNSATIGTYDPFSGIWTIGDLLAGQTAVLTVTVTVNPSGDYVNTAMILVSDPDDTDLDDNLVLVEIDVICLTVYNEFSPNGDGQNEFFIIDCIENYPNNNLNIFNRYGNEVYSEVSYNNNWNGISNAKGVVNKGEPLPVGTYFYVLKIDVLNYSKSGWLYIAR